jgi:hypothetical protein
MPIQYIETISHLFLMRQKRRYIAAIEILVIFLKQKAQTISLGFSFFL